MFKGFHGQAELSNETFAELDDHHHLGHVDAAFRMHFENSSDHDHMFFFLVMSGFCLLRKNGGIPLLAHLLSEE